MVHICLYAVTDGNFHTVIYKRDMVISKIIINELLHNYMY